MRTFEGILEQLKPHEFFVFGSNTQGRHGKGAAKTARDLFGAVYGQAEGPQGQSYAIVTKDLTKPKDKQMRSVKRGYIRTQIVQFLEFTAEHPELTFYVTQFGSSLAGYKPEEIASLFTYYDIPDNVVMNQEYADIINEQWFNRFRGD